MTKFANSLLILFLGLAACGDDVSPTMDDAGASSAALRGEMPCEIKPIVDKYCSTCHGVVPTGGAPMSLVSAADFQAIASNGKYVHARVLEKLVDKVAPMPPVARPQPSADELAALRRWLEGGAQKSAEATCAPVVAASDAGTAQYLPPTVPDSECEMIVELRTHGGQTLPDTSKFPVNGLDEHYQCFYFEVPWPTKMHILKFEPLIDNARVLHHWLLYQESTIQSPNGSNVRCGGSHPTAALLTGWAPGGFGASMPPDVGLQTANGPTTQFNLEVHYNNATSSDVQPDASGVRICATSKLRKNEAAAHWLGTELIANLPGQIGTASSTCNPKQTAHILSVSPHMHRTGKHMTTSITRADGGVEMLTDRPFDFNDQQIYPVGGAAGEVIVGPGDKLDTVCTYENDTKSLITFGSLTSQEMCYDFVVAWPAGALGTGGGIVDGPNRCMR
ncbi:MAG: hypothetical protein JWN48_1644 [Myxococcaceae bacterium]|nr:hypothetical protein [Myxococcaceae bacterium]